MLCFQTAASLELSGDCCACYSEKTICGLCEIFAFIGYSQSENEPITSKQNNSRGLIGWTVRHRLKVDTNVYKFKSN